LTNINNAAVRQVDTEAFFRRKDPIMYKRILVPVDGSPTSLKALDAAINMAKESGGQLRLLHLREEMAYLSYDPYGSYYAELLNVAREAGVKILADGVAVAQLAGVAADSSLIEELGEGLGEAVATAASDWKADLIVVGTHGRRGVGRLFLGSGAEQVIRMAPIPTLVIRSDKKPA
jgi:nucleotide-binding universal stress UspA family protein